MASEVTIAREGGVQSLNAERKASRRSLSSSAQSRSNKEVRKAREKARLKLNKTIAISGSMPASGRKVQFTNLYTGKLRRSGEARDDFLYHAKSPARIRAAKYIWNHPELLRDQDPRPFGEGKDPNNQKDAKNLAKKWRNGIRGFVAYKADYGGRTWTVKTAKYKKGYETLYFII